MFIWVYMGEWGMDKENERHIQIMVIITNAYLEQKRAKKKNNQYRYVLHIQEMHYIHFLFQIYNLCGCVCLNGKNKRQTSRKKNMYCTQSVFHPLFVRYQAYFHPKEEKNTTSCFCFFFSVFFQKKKKKENYTNENTLLSHLCFLSLLNIFSSLFLLL